jgi:anti-anti-sigma factor
MAGGVPVITAPAEIDITNAGQLRAILAEWHARGHTTVVVDLTGTRFCDSAGLHVLVRAHQRAVPEGGGLRLAIRPDSAVLRIFTVTGLDGVIPRFASVDQALAQVPATAPQPRLGSPPESVTTPASQAAQGREHGPGDESRCCAQCGAAFVPQREHARFCSAGCRTIWNREHQGIPRSRPAPSPGRSPR